MRKLGEARALIAMLAFGVAMGILGEYQNGRAHRAAMNPPVRMVKVVVKSSVKSAMPIPYARLLDHTVKVNVGHGTGTGVVVTRQVAGKLCVYVWTAGHVVDSLQKGDGWADATVSREIRVDGIQTKTVTAKAKVIAYSPPEEEDLALLEIIENVKDFSVGGTFYLEPDCLPIGTEIIHVGCTLGIYGSVSRGIISMTDRDLPGVVCRFDQTSCMGYPGSSGGGVYLKTGECIGLLVRGSGPGLNWIVPVRRMAEWAKAEGLTWALDESVPVPLSREHTKLEATP